MHTYKQYILAKYVIKLYVCKHDSEAAFFYSLRLLFDVNPKYFGRMVLMHINDNQRNDAVKLASILSILLKSKFINIYKLSQFYRFNWSSNYFCQPESLVTSNFEFK